jgi:hypothetical protein
MYAKLSLCGDDQAMMIVADLDVVQDAIPDSPTATAIDFSLIEATMYLFCLAANKV